MNACLNMLKWFDWFSWRIQMDKLKMAHELLVSALKGGAHLGSDHAGTAQYFFDLADAMQVEAVADVGNTDVSEWQPDWSQAPAWAEWWAVDDNGEGWFYGTQPSMGLCSWFIGVYGESMFHNDSYKGDWQDSLRKRPDSK